MILMHKTFQQFELLEHIHQIYSNHKLLNLVSFDQIMGHSLILP
jgi:hypothetical protein